MKINDNEISSLKISKIPYSKFFCWGSDIEDKFKKKGIQNVIPIGAPFIYLADDFNEKIDERRNVLIFPPHSNWEENKKSGFTDKQINRIFGPIGIKLGGKSAPEIALSIISQLVSEVYKK